MTEKKKKSLKNDEMSYTAWISHNGIDPEAIKGAAISKAKADNKLSDVNYGAKSEALSKNDLNNDGYASYLRALSDEKEDDAIRYAEEAFIQNQYKNADGYAEYLEKYNTLQEKLKESVNKTLMNMKCFDLNKAYEIALSEGLNHEYASYAAIEGTKMAKDKVVEDAISYINGRNYSSLLARRYAENLGLPEAYVNRILKSTKVRYESQADSLYEELDPTDYEDFLNKIK